MAASASIIAPNLYDEMAIKAISADGNVAVSDLNGVVTVIDLATGNQRVFAPDENYINYYGIGYGSPITADGSVIVGNTIESGNACYLDADGWHSLKVADESMVNFAHGITADGSRICGCIGTHEMSINEDVLMGVPAYWDRNADGTYGDPVVLPHPVLDLYGQTPQYVTAVCISDDGKTILGQMTDCMGAMVIPVLYKQDDKGEWSYSLPTQHLFNPEGLTPVENPGEYSGPAYPSEESFMTEEEIAAYDAAVTAWYETREGDFPQYDSYMTDEEKAAFAAAKAEYLEAYSKYDELFSAYQDYFYNVLAASANFEFNSIAMSPDGKLMASSSMAEIENPDPMGWFPTITVYYPWVINLENGDITKYEGNGSLLVSDVTDKGEVLASNPASMGEFALIEGIILSDGVGTKVTDMLHGIDPEYTEWFKTNLSHEIADYVYNEETEEYEEVYNEYVFTGTPVATPDLSVIAFWNNADWDYGMSGQSVLIQRNDLGSVDTVTLESKGLALDAAGNLCVADDVVSVEVFDVAGACVLSVDAPASTVALPLESGVYVARATHASGATEAIKIAK